MPMAVWAYNLYLALVLRQTRMWPRMKESYWPLFGVKALFTTSGQGTCSSHKIYDLGGQHGLPEIVSDCPVSKVIVLFLISETSNGSYCQVRTLNQLQGKSHFGPYLRFFGLIQVQCP